MTDRFDAWHDARWPEPPTYRHKVDWRWRKRERREAWDAALATAPAVSGAVDDARVVATAYWKDGRLLHVLDCSPLPDGAHHLYAAAPAVSGAGESWLPDEGAYLIRFDDASVDDELFAMTGAKEAALYRYRQISGNWNAHLYVKINSNSCDESTPSATPPAAVSDPVAGVVDDELPGMWSRSDLIGGEADAAPSVVDPINYFTLHEFAERNRVDYNDLCNTVRRALTGQATPEGS